MVRNYVRKTKRQEWCTESMNAAVDVVVSGQMGYRRAAEQHGVPQTTLERYVAKKRKDQQNFVVDKSVGKFRSVFSQEQEIELVDYLKSMESRLFGLTMMDFRRLAFQLAIRNQCQHKFNAASEMAGKDWMQCFLKRHPTLTLRKPESTSGARAMGFNKVAVAQFFHLLLETVDKYKLAGERIYNCDETGLTVNPKGHTKILALKGKRQVGTLTSAERGETITAEICFSAAGAYMPPMLIFPRKRKQQSFELGLPPGSVVEVSDSGWITSELFLNWFKLFVTFSKATKENPVLLLLDGHATHTKNIDLILHARENGVILLCFPPHTSHRLQPLDVSFMKPLSTFYEHETRTWLRCNPGKVITILQISTLLVVPFKRSHHENAATTDITNNTPPSANDPSTAPRAHTPTEPSISITPPATKISNLRKSTKSPLTVSASDILNPLPGCSLWKAPNEFAASGVNKKSSFPCLSPEVALPIPKIQQTVKRANRKRGKTAILTSTPYKEELEAAAAAKKVSQKMKEGVKRKIIGKENKSKASNIKKVKRNPSKKVSIKKVDSDSSSDETSDVECLYCCEYWSKSVEGWIACSACHKWAHNACAGVDSEDDEFVLVCEQCQS
ncbi:uncharacterized protein LOC115883165 [Sitophilus oryzae]|uniref:Uncharacterized protein LOC115883165 n=1 Tax=Sitophilus oryzae TaxID=7048 RepID=A0A6J2Y0U8_SITOR|nr:uncharacterized protein LOC115883165 [Sitophilus oryzae]